MISASKVCGLQERSAECRVQKGKGREGAFAFHSRAWNSVRRTRCDLGCECFNAAE